MQRNLQTQVERHTMELDNNRKNNDAKKFANTGVHVEGSQ